MGRSLSINTLRRKSVKNLDAAIELASQAGDYKMLARLAVWQARIASQIERNRPKQKQAKQDAGVTLG